MRGINKVILIGNIGKEPEYKTLQDGTPVAKLTIATTESYRLKNGDAQSRTEWHSIIVWRALATFANKYIQKGSLIYIEGKLRSRRYEDKEGHKKYVTEVVADQVLLLEKKLKATEEGIEEISKEELPF
ncbi:MAG: single-stranded DNA-binding protein [Ginsengibacter sp.]